MRAVMQERFGPPERLTVRDVPVPEIGDDGILVRVRAAGVNAYDGHMIRGTPYVARLLPGFGFRRPSHPVAGVDVAGVVEHVGATVTAFRPGDEVFGARNGGFADYVAARERNLVAKPACLSFEEAAAIPTASTTALLALRDQGGVQPGQRVLVVGAGGGVGSAAVQLGKALGADVTAVTGPTAGGMVMALGADLVIDRTREDWTRPARPDDVIVDVSAERGIRATRHALAPAGTLVLTGAPAGRVIGPMIPALTAPIHARLAHRRVVSFVARHGHDTLATLAGFATDGMLRPVIDRTFALEDAAAAVRYVETGQAHGKVVLTL